MKSPLLSQIPGFIHGFGDALTPIPEELQPFWAPSLKPVWKQTHSNQWSEIQSAGQSCGEVDALMTRKPGLPIAVITADCVPLLLAKKNGRCAVAIHAGWRGTFSRILRAVWKNLSSTGEEPRQWLAAIGPSIRGCCYEVGENLIHDFESLLAKEHGSFPRDKVFPTARKLDLASIHRFELERLGFAGIDLLPECTFCSRAGSLSDAPFRFQSHRRDHAGKRQYSGCVLPSSRH